LMTHSRFRLQPGMTSVTYADDEGSCYHFTEDPPIWRSKDVSSLVGARKAALRGRSQEATVGGWLKSARLSGSSDGLQVSVI
jgi:hypothetical protein